MLRGLLSLDEANAWLEAQGKLRVAKAKLSPVRANAGRSRPQSAPAKRKKKAAASDDDDDDDDDDEPRKRPAKVSCATSVGRAVACACGHCTDLEPGFRPIRRLLCRMSAVQVTQVNWHHQSLRRSCSCPKRVLTFVLLLSHQLALQHV